ncbi:hypothetical protein VKT23_015353 [Stygiomarasmius scandens]|uniref:Laccase n=1 Tax=Marasmiellus scandens TaxID=2682957 RepID=A0ABR1IY82_9AGAR
MKPPRVSSHTLLLLGLLRGFNCAVRAQDDTTTATTAAATTNADAVSYSAVTTVSASGAPQASISSMPPLAPTNTLSATAPTGSAYVLNSTFDINSDAVTRTYDFILAVQTGSPDGYNRSYITINGQTPGPLIEANEGDTLVSDNQTTSIHWHGMFQNGSQYMDGVPGVSQCPIQPGESFTYQFTVNQYGTYWYHSHSSVQYTDGLGGPLIIHSVDDPLVRGTDFDYEMVLFVNDWYHDDGNTIVNDLLSVDGYDGTPAAPSPQSGLVNGQGRYDCSLLDSDDTTSCTTPTSYPVFNLVPDAKTRFRLINAGSHAQFYFSVDEHTVTVVEADGTPVSGSGDLHRIPFHNGQRYSAIVDTTVGSEGDSYWMRFTMNTDCFAWVDDTLNATVYTILRYGNTTDSSSDPTSSDWSDTIGSTCVDLDESLLVPVVEKDAQTTTDAVVSFNSSFGQLVSDGNTYGRFFVNATSYTNYIYQPILEGIASEGTSFINSSAVASAIFEDDVWIGDIIASDINNLDGGLDHPYHLHGNEFQIVARGSGTLDAAEAASIDYNTTNPLRRDTLVIPGGEYAVLRISTQ